MLESEKTWVFWVGLIVFALAGIAVFSVVWFLAVVYSPYLNIEYQVKISIPFIIGGIIFIIVGST